MMMTMVGVFRMGVRMGLINMTMIRIGSRKGVMRGDLNYFFFGGLKFVSEIKGEVMLSWDWLTVVIVVVVVVVVLDFGRLLK